MRRIPRSERWWKYATAILVIASLFAFSPAPRPVTYDLNVVVDASAPDGASLAINVVGDSETYVANHELAHVCIPVTPDSAGSTARVIMLMGGQPIGAVVVVFFPTDQLPEVKIVADSTGVHIRRSAAVTCAA